MPHTGKAGGEPRTAPPCPGPEFSPSIGATPNFFLALGGPLAQPPLQPCSCAHGLLFYFSVDSHKWLTAPLPMFLQYVKQLREGAVVSGLRTGPQSPRRATF